MDTFTADGTLTCVVATHMTMPVTLTEAAPAPLLTPVNNVAVDFVVP